ncbi:polysaccharide pyruvyl transferase family protein [Rhodococcus sp. IEGM 1379]|uniref:polysaccharide pyruvyl transferase family protein n=1 Tax=Rhodococcus sp. IEGM 1379 TaxID=3047086 RepID=UPI0024B743C0|nr:polysaccharide pyruvyl transferase family protein [Rhodococcus sp. IEGM 1379]MDI9915075.1 polysaccharide pyruvyl transferase family protein [Rhodococcus sp. IEGM 1379]
MNVLILHGYSADNAGDGLLVHETISLVRDALGENSAITVAASHPETFSELDARIVDSSICRTGYRRAYIGLLRSLDQFDVVIGVGGGYLRAGYPIEMLKTLLIHGPQLWAASRTSTPTVYLPQSVGPAGRFAAKAIAARMKKIDSFYVRDDRTSSQYGTTGAVRASDLAILSARPLERTGSKVDCVPVISVRAVRGRVSPLVIDFARQVGQFDGYVQSTTGGNNDIDAMRSLGARDIVSREGLMTPPVDAPRRIVVAVRLHAALMALRAGHLVIHLAYERKGFGAFQDLGLEEYVHNVNKFEPARVFRQMNALIEDDNEQRKYLDRVDAALQTSPTARQALVEDLRRRAGIPDSSLLDREVLL